MGVGSRTIESPRILRRTFRLWARFYSDSLRGLPPPCTLRLAASWRKYSLPRLAVWEPPFLPNNAAAGSFSCLNISSVKAMAALSSSRHRAVRLSGSSVVDRIRSVSESSRFSVPSSWRDVGIHQRYEPCCTCASDCCFLSTHI